jgi:hypothetical protein
MLRIDDEKKEVRVVEKKACRGISMHLEWGPLLNLFNSCSRVGIWVNTKSLSGVSLGWVE